MYFEDERVQRFENQGVPTQTDLAQLELDLRRAIAANKKNERKPSMWKRMTGRGDTESAPAPEAKTSAEAEGQKPPDPVPPSEPLPAPAGTPSGQP